MPSSMRDTVAGQCRAETGEVRRPSCGSHTSQTEYLTSAAIDALDYDNARKARETCTHLPTGTLVAITGGKHITDAGTVFARLDKSHAKNSDMVLVHDGPPGVEMLATHWARRFTRFPIHPRVQHRAIPTDGEPEPW